MATKKKVGYGQAVDPRKNTMPYGGTSPGGDAWSEPSAGGGAVPVLPPGIYPPMGAPVPPSMNKSTGAKKPAAKKKTGAGQSSKKVGVGGFIGNIPPQSQVPMSLQGALAGGGANPPMAAPPVMSQPGVGPMPPGMGGGPAGGMPPGPPMLSAPPKKAAPKKRGKSKTKAKAKSKPASKKAAPKKKAAGKTLPPWLAGKA